MDIADLGIVGDLKVIIPKLTEAIKKAKELRLLIKLIMEQKNIP